jgi:hypothetical protein
MGRRLKRLHLLGGLLIDFFRVLLCSYYPFAFTVQVIKKMRSFILCLLAVSTAFGAPADMVADAGSKTGTCPGGYAEGAEIERGRLVYICQGGQVVAKGCIAEDLSKISIGGNYDNGKFRKACKLGSDGQLSYEATGCLSNGQEHKPGDSWEDGSNAYTCKQNADGTLASTPVGCVDGGKRVNQKEKVPKDDTLYECQPAQNGKFSLLPVGCVKDGKQLNFGDSVEVGQFWFNCTRLGREKASLKAGGCVAAGKRLNDGDRYNDGEVFRECTIDNGKTATRTVACVQKDETGNIVERRLGCTWVEGTAPFQYEWACKHDAAADTAVKVQVRCNYNVGGGIYQVEPGCYRTVDKGVAGCIPDGKGMKLQLFEGDKADGAAQGAGLHAC